MLGHKIREFKPLAGICLEDLVPEENFYRQVERSIDLSFVRELVAACYSNIGRTSVDPVVFFKLQLIAFFEGIRSERKLMEMVNLNLAHRCIVFSDRDPGLFPHIVTLARDAVCLSPKSWEQENRDGRAICRGSKQIEGGVVGPPGVEQTTTGRSSGSVQVLGQEMVAADPQLSTGRSTSTARPIAGTEASSLRLVGASDPADPRAAR